MTNPHHPMSHSADPHPVRPGTSAALTARTIDATVHPPLIRAQETVAALIPRIAAPLGSPLLLSTLGLTLALVWLARRARFQPSALLLSGMLVMTLTSFHPMRSATEPEIADEPQITDNTVRRQPKSWMDFREDKMPRYVQLIPPTVTMMLRREDVRAAIQEIRFRLRQEARRIERRRHY